MEGIDKAHRLGHRVDRHIGGRQHLARALQPHAFDILHRRLAHLRFEKYVEARQREIDQIGQIRHADRLVHMLVNKGKNGQHALGMVQEIQGVLARRGDFAKNPQ